MSRIAMSGNREDGSIIGVFLTKDAADVWIEKMLKEFDDEYVTSVELEQVNTKWRAGIIFKKKQTEFDFDN